MDQLLLGNCEKLIRFREAFYKAMAFETSPNETAIMAAFLCLASRKEADLARYQACKEILKKEVGAFHEFRGEARPLILAKMAMQDDPNAYLEGILAVYKKFRARHKFSSSSFVAMASITLFEKGGVPQADAYLDEMDQLYAELKKSHPFLISYQDYGYLAMLSTSMRGEAGIAEEIEENYQALKGIAIDKDAVLSLCQVLSLSSGGSSDKAKKVGEVLGELKEKGRPIHKSYGLAALGALSLTDLPTETIVEKIIEADDYLSHKKGFRANGARLRRVFASLLVLLTYGGGEREAVSNIVGTLTMEIIEEITMMLLVMCINASVAASSSSH